MNLKYTLMIFILILKKKQFKQKKAKILQRCKTKQAMELLNDEVIPQHKDHLDKLSNVDLTEPELIEFNKLSQEITQIKLNQRLYSKNLFEDIIAAHEKEN